jgi:hypothetical protein
MVLKAAFKLEVHRLTVLSYTPQVFHKEMSWLSDLYISCGYPPLVVHKWIKDTSHNAYSNCLIWKTSEKEDIGIWPLKSTMNLVCQNLEFLWFHSLLTDTMVSAGMNQNTTKHWCKRVVKSLKCPLNLGDKENLYNHSICHIMKRMP